MARSLPHSRSEQHDSEQEPARVCPHHHHIFDRVYLVVSSSARAEAVFHYVDLDRSLKYFSFSGLDFGPPDLECTYRFCRELSDMLNKHQHKLIALHTPPNRKSVTNTMFALGAFLIMERDWPPARVMDCFELKALLSYRDVSPGRQNFDLQVAACARYDHLHAFSGL